MKHLLTLENRFEGDLLWDALKRKGIPCVIKSFEDKAYDGPYVSQMGGGRSSSPRRISKGQRR